MSNRKINVYKVAILALLSSTIFFTVSSYIYSNRLEILKEEVLYYNYENGSKGIKDIAKRI